MKRLIKEHKNSITIDAVNTNKHFVAFRAYGKRYGFLVFAFDSQKILRACAIQSSATDGFSELSGLTLDSVYAMENFEFFVFDSRAEFFQFLLNHCQEVS